MKRYIKANAYQSTKYYSYRDLTEVFDNELAPEIDNIDARLDGKGLSRQDRIEYVVDKILHESFNYPCLMSRYISKNPDDVEAYIIHYMGID